MYPLPETQHEKNQYEPFARNLNSNKTQTITEIQGTNCTYGVVMFSKIEKETRRDIEKTRRDETTIRLQEPRW